MLSIQRMGCMGRVPHEPRLTVQLEVTEDNLTITAPSFGGSTGNSRIVDWGDGTIVQGIAALNDHTYAAPGTYTYKVWGVRGATSAQFQVEPWVLSFADLVYDGRPRLPNLQVLSILGTQSGGIASKPPYVTGNIGALAAYTTLNSLSVQDHLGLSLDGIDLLPVSMTTFNLGGFYGTQWIDGDLGDFAAYVNLETFNIQGPVAPNASALTGNLNALAGMSSLAFFSALRTQVSTFSGGVLPSTFRSFNINSCQFDATNLGAVVDTLHAMRATLALNGTPRSFNLADNPGSASVASSHATKISEMQAAGLTVSI